MENKQKYLIFLLLIIAIINTVNTQKCKLPQKALFMSYNAMSKRDTIANMFDEINSIMEKFNDSSYTENNTAYSLMNLHPQMYYSQHEQVQTFVDQQKVNVTLGDIQFAFKMNYTIEYGGQIGNKTGYARGRVLMDQQKYFIKRLISNEGILEWDPVQIAQLTASYPLDIDHSQPELTVAQRTIYIQILNDHVGAKKIKQTILQSFNFHYKQILKKHLNSEHLASDITIKYKYNDLQIDYINLYRNYQLHNDKNRGLEVFYTFEVQNETLDCFQENITISQQQGGLQQIITTVQLTNSLIAALQKGIADVKVDKKWQVPAFQFYMGDLGNIFPAAYKYKPDDQFYLNCQWNKNKSDIQFSNHDVHESYVAFGIICVAKHNQTQLFKFQADISMVVRFYAEQDQLVVVIASANKFNQIITAIHEDFKLFNEGIAGTLLSKVLMGMAGQQTFGTGWKIYERRFPSLKLTTDYMVIFDPSQK